MSSPGTKGEKEDSDGPGREAVPPKKKSGGGRSPPAPLATAADAAASLRAQAQDQTQTQAQGHDKRQGQDLEAGLLLHHQRGVTASSAATAVPAAVPPPAIPRDSAADPCQQMQALVAHKREQLAAALMAQQQLSAASSSASAAVQARSLGGLLHGAGDLPAAGSIVGLGLGTLGTTDTSTRAAQGSIRAAAANLAAAQAQAQAQAEAQALGSPETALRSSYLMGSMGSVTSPAREGGGRTSTTGGLTLGTAPGRTNDLYYDLLSSQNNQHLQHLLPPQFVGSAYNPLSTGQVEPTTMETNAMLQHRADLEYLQQLRQQRLLLSSISASTAASISALAGTAALGLSPNDTAILARLQREASGSRAGAAAATVSSSSSSLGFPSAAASVASPASLMAAAESQSVGQGQGRQGMGEGPGLAQRPGRAASGGDGPRASKAPPLPNITAAAARAPVDQRITRSDGVVCLSSGTPHYTNRTIVPLSAPDDVHWLSTYLCFVREKCVEIFEADAAEINCRSNSKLINDRQVGIRCRYCAHVHQRDRAGRSMSFPSSLSRIYQSLTMMLREHFPTCTEMPTETKQRFLALKGQKTSGPGQNQRRQFRGSDISAKESRSYWVDSAKGIGLYDTALGIKRRGPPA